MAHPLLFRATIGVATVLVYAVIFALTGAELFNYLPIMFVITVAVIVGIYRWPRHPRVSLFMVTGAAVLVLTVVAAVWHRGYPFVQSLLCAEGLSFVFAAAFLDR